MSSIALSQKTSSSFDNPQRPCNASLAFNAGSSPEWRGQSFDIDGSVLKTYGMVAAGVSL